MIVNGVEVGRNYVARNAGEMLAIHGAKSQGGGTYSLNGHTCTLSDYNPPEPQTLLEHLRGLGYADAQMVDEDVAYIPSADYYYMWHIRPTKLYPHCQMRGGQTIEEARYVERDGWGWAQ